MTLRKNRLRELLRAGKPSQGTHLLSSWPTITEIVGQTGVWDYIEFVAEYTPWTMYDLDNLGRAIELFPDFTGMVKIEQDTRGHLAMRAIGAGIQNLLFADIRTPDEARQCVRSVRAEHPDHGGLHGVGMRRDVRTILHGGSPEWVDTLAECVIVLMIEKQQAIQNLEAILDVEGIDMVQFGPSDYAMSIGLPGQGNHEKVREAERYMVEVAHKRGIPARAEIRDPSGAQQYLDMGVRHFCVGWDVRILNDWFTSQGKAMQDLLTGNAPSLAVPAPARSGYN
ncbi:MAG TPA: aldolase/citrate lyase family protein [Chloroflexota bacterium]|jgi:4-hydroxy-2-oxoheptanedioate aldolase|nr:aldolase/citrate lyase family protein [Chloroflexota bacterium]